MLNDLKFLYYLFTNYTLEEIKILFKTIEILPIIFFQYFQKVKI